MAVYTPSDLGWTTGTDVSESMATFWNSTAAEGDELHIDTAVRYDINYNGPASRGLMPTGCKLTAVDGGGFNITNGSEGTGGFGFVYLGQDCLVDNLTVRAPNAPVSGYTGLGPQNPTDFINIRFLMGSVESAFHKSVPHNSEIRNCDMEGQIGSWLVFSGSDSQPLNDVKVYGNRFFGGQYSVLLTGDVYRPRFYQNYFEYGMIDAIKTFNDSSAAAPYRYKGPRSDGAVVNCRGNHFKDINRDAYDTTGGWCNMVHEDDLCEDSVLFDLKMDFNSLGSLADENELWDPFTQEYGSHGIVVRRCHSVFSRAPYATPVTLTMNLAEAGTDGWDTAEANYDRVNIRDLTFEDCIVEYTFDNSGSPEERFVFFKGGQDVTVTNLQVRGYDGTYTVFDEDGLTGIKDVGVGTSTSTGFSKSNTPSPSVPSASWRKVPVSASGETILPLGRASLNLTATVAS